MFPEEAQGTKQHSGYYIFMMLFHFFILPLPKVCMKREKKEAPMWGINYSSFRGGQKKMEI